MPTDSDALRFEVKVSATGVVRDAGGDVISVSPVTFETVTLTAEQLDALGLEHDPHRTVTTPLNLKEK